MTDKITGVLHDNYDAYIGDGVYAGHDDWQIWLMTERDGLKHEIALEPQVLQRLIEYMNYVIARARATSSELEESPLNDSSKGE